MITMMAIWPRVTKEDYGRLAALTAGMGLNLYKVRPKEHLQQHIVQLILNWYIFWIWCQVNRYQLYIKATNELLRRDLELQLCNRKAFNPLSPWDQHSRTSFAYTGNFPKIYGCYADPKVTQHGPMKTTSAECVGYPDALTLLICL